ncbi:MAG: efflux RND transporter periplasmic adaptor subunit [Hyphomicrobiales bacterium]|nr:efflux RND transporter periplasmic adaptor subunit [Hyphomicrobiales bacterium]MCP5371991.1 efflux RND transporter periplasmic adaptor subunit [Hyphomicrobiales bacterium]
MRRFALVLLIALAAGGGGYYLLSGDDQAAAPKYRQAKVERGAVRMAVSSTGKVNPVVTVQVGSQVSGQISELPADFNTAVQAGQIIARIDPAAFDAKVRVARAEVAVAEANVAMQRASLAEMRAEITGAEAALKEAEQDLKRKRVLVDRGAVSESAVDTAVAARDQGRARIESLRARLLQQQAQLQTAQAQVQAKEATLRDRELDLEHTFIRSPVDGVVIGRDVDIGQTVAASLQAPVLFTIAQDLRRMQVEISVDEADIGRVHEDQRVEFSVDAFPSRTFAGAVTQIRKQPTEVSNVVTYTVIASADNPGQQLLPGMTANVDIVVGTRDDVLKVPDAALRFTPAGAQPAAAAPQRGPEAGRERMERLMQGLTKRLNLTAEQQEKVRAIFVETGGSIRALRQGGEGGGGDSDEAVRQLRAQAVKRVAALLDEGQRKIYAEMQADRAAGVRSRGRVWKLGADGTPVPVNVVAGLSDGTMTELVGGDLAEGDQVIVGVDTAAGRR